MEIDPNMPGMDAASALLDEMIAEESAASASKPSEAAAEVSATEEQRAAQGIDENAKAPDPLLTDTPAAAEKPAAPESDKSQKPAEPTKAEAEKSRYAKSQERLNKTWDSVNAEKATVTAEKARIETERAELARQKAEFETIRKQAEQPQHPPEAYAQAAASKKQMADHQRAEATRLEDDGRFSDAEALRKQATKNEAIAEDLADHAEKLRKNPPPAFTDRAAQFEQSRKEWTLQAAKDYPELAKENSVFQRSVAAHLNALAKSDPQLMAQPSMIYQVAKLAATELKAQQFQADAARVPVLVKELGELKAKVKELESTTTPGSSATVPRIGSTAMDDGEAELERMARELVTLR